VRILIVGELGIGWWILGVSEFDVGEQRNDIETVAMLNCKNLNLNNSDEEKGSFSWKPMFCVK